MQSLSDLDAAILEFESHAPRGIGPKEEAIRAELDISPVRYHQRLNVLLDAPAAAEAYPVLVARLRRVRDGRQEARRAAREDAPDLPN
ncbi:Fis family transcriptional regulator [Corynebacterium sp. HMSC06D04]|uniref:DUF3263 domain-containing protein n=1 Tax=unclassified Corynebacterium TaxID=2624378 RepID=UPI0008A5D94F|nr:DUF3263 domain-containing protein [Corynebacterium sp. HMSC06D04]MDU3175051.1 DUF3263 domain-containing protein [Corynebacterium striatum]OFT53569.1 Fis family transcriptional regulator [Corynebacterium sp. HMSC06D04]